MQLTFENLVVFLAFILYTVVCITHVYKQNYAWAVVWGGYAVSNLGLIVAQSMTK
jgi:hypothetical protein